MKQRFFILVALLFVVSSPLRGEDWTTTDGKSYQDVKVLKVEPDAVTIIHREGGSLVPLATLSPELQQRFKYDPDKAKAAAASRAQADKDSIKALQAEKDKENAEKLAAAQGAAKSIEETATNSSTQQLKPAKNDPLQTQSGKGDGPRGPQQNDDRPHYTGM